MSPIIHSMLLSRDTNMSNTGINDDVAIVGSDIITSDVAVEFNLYCAKSHTLGWTTRDSCVH